MKTLIKYFDYVENAFLFLSKLAVFLMMLVTSADAIFRHFFDSPIVGAYDFTKNYLMVVAVFLSLSYVMKVKGHIKVDMLEERMPKPLVKFLNVIFLLAGALLMWVIGYQGILTTEEAWVNNYTSTGIIPWPTWLSVIWVPIGSFLFVIRLIIETIKIIMGIDSHIEKEAQVDNGDPIVDEEAAFKLAIKLNQEQQEKQHLETAQRNIF